MTERQKRKHGLSLSSAFSRAEKREAFCRTGACAVITEGLSPADRHAVRHIRQYRLVEPGAPDDPEYTAGPHGFACRPLFGRNKFLFFVDWKLENTPKPCGGGFLRFFYVVYGGARGDGGGAYGPHRFSGVIEVRRRSLLLLLHRSCVLPEPHG